MNKLKSLLTFKNCSFLISALLVQILLKNHATAQSTQNWYNVSSDGYKFKMPTQPLQFDSLGTKLFSCGVDSAIAIQTHIFNDARFNGSEQVFSEA